MESPGWTRIGAGKSVAPPASGSTSAHVEAVPATEVVSLAALSSHTWGTGIEYVGAGTNVVAVSIFPLQQSNWFTSSNHIGAAAEAVAVTAAAAAAAEAVAVAAAAAAAAEAGSGVGTNTGENVGGDIW